MESKARILVVDDRERTVRAIQRVLQKEGYEVLTAFDGVTGLKKICEEKPDLIILDVMMPGMDGYEVCRRMQRDPATARIPVLILTGKGRLDYEDSGFRVRVQEQIEGYDSGAMEFLTKPVRWHELVKRVKGLLWMSGT
ncbi:MAG: response regulator [Anaerolineae bacterium]